MGTNRQGGSRGSARVSRFQGFGTESLMVMVLGGLGRQTALAQTDKSEVGTMMPNGFVARNDCR